MHEVMWQSVRQLIVFFFIQEMEGCDAGEERNMNGSVSDETVETQVDS